MLELLKLKTSEAAALQVHIIGTATLYFAIMGAVFKFTFDTPKLRTMVPLVALATSCVFCLAALYGHYYRKALIHTLTSLRKELGLAAFEEDLPGVKYSIVLAVCIATVIIVTWVAVLAQP